MGERVEKCEGGFDPEGKRVKGEGSLSLAGKHPGTPTPTAPRESTVRPRRKYGVMNEKRVW